MYSRLLAPYAVDLLTCLDTRAPTAQLGTTLAGLGLASTVPKILWVFVGVHKSGSTSPSSIVTIKTVVAWHQDL